MESRLNLDDVALFLAVAEAGSLSGASRKTGVAISTLSRRMTGFERAVGRRLFRRGPQGYALTADGRSLRERADPLAPLADRIGQWIAKDAAPPKVRITAGTWTSRFLARNIGIVWTAGSGWVPEFLASNATVDIARREADIGIRNRRPDQPWLAGRRTVTIRYAVYGRDNDVTGFLSLATGQPTTPSERWLAARHGGDIVSTVNDARLALDLSLEGIGRILLPTFAGDAETGLLRLSEPIDEITHDEWLVSHHEARHDPPVRAALDALHRLLTATDRSPQASSSASQ